MPSTVQPFTYFSQDFLTGDSYGTLPFRGVTFGGQMASSGGIGQFQGYLDVTDPRVQNIDWIAATTPNHSIIVVDYNGTPFAYMVTSRKWTVDASGETSQRTLEVDGSELWQFFGQENQATDYSSPPYSGITGDAATMPIWNQANVSLSGTPYGWDPMLMAAQMLVDKLTAPAVNGPFIVQLNGFGVADDGAAYVASGTGTPSFNYVSESFPFTSIQTVSACVLQLAQMGLYVGFDIGIDVAYSAGPGSPIVATVNLSFPRRGRTTNQNFLSINLARARTYSFPEDGTQSGNTVYETGGNQDIVATQNIYAIAAGYPSMDKTINQSMLNSANITAILSAMGLGDLVLYGFPLVAPTFTVAVDDPEIGLGTFITGDDVQVIIPQYDQDQQIFDPRFPAGMDSQWRIPTWAVTVADEGDSTLMCTLDTPPAASRTAPAI